MTTAQAVVSYAKSLVGQKVTVPTNPFGGQCISLIDHIVQHFTNGQKNLGYTNAIDGLKKARQQGLQVVDNNPNDPNLLPQVGDFFVMSVPEHGFGHIGVVVSADVNGMHTIEQNIDGYRDDNSNGINDQLEEGGGGYTRENYRDYTGVVGWFRLPYDNKKEGNKVSIPTKNVNGDIFSNLVTRVDPNIMYSSSDRLPIDHIIIHHNAGTNDANARATWYVANGHQTSAHYQVTDKDIWGCVGEQAVAWHSGNYNMNQRSIGIEHLNNTGAPNWTIAEETYKNSARLIADIATRYNIPIDRQHIIPHRDVVATACPGGIDVDRLIRMAKEYVSGGTISKKETVQKPAISKTETTSSFKVRVSVTDLNIRKEPSVKSKSKGYIKPGVYTITETKVADGYDWGKLKSGAGWIALKYTKRL